MLYDCAHYCSHFRIITTIICCKKSSLNMLPHRGSISYKSEKNGAEETADTLDSYGWFSNTFKTQV